MMSSNGFSHLDQEGRARMVDIGGKTPSKRKAVAHAEVLVGEKVGRAIIAGNLTKGDVFAAARIAGIQAAKRTWELIPLCHPLPLQAVEVDLVLSEDATRVEITASAQVEGKTGVEMEALTAAAAAALTVYDMCKSLDKGMEINRIYLTHKTGGKSGEWNKATRKP